jgi:hypothetical protein
MICSTDLVASANLQARFMEILPRIEGGARIYFRDIRCAFRKADYVAEAVGIAWKWFRRLTMRGKDVTKFIGALARMAARAVRAGRRVGAGERANDIMSPVAQRRHGFTVQALPPTRQSYENLNGSVDGQRMQDVLEQCLTDNSVTPPPEQAAFRIDFPAWMGALSARERRIIRAMSLSERTKDLSRRFDITPGRISQMRKEFKLDWQQYCGDVEEKMTA